MEETDEAVNRTNVELKYLLYKPFLGSLPTVNRTNVELKFQVNFFKCFKIPPVNRTNVELKLLICCAKLSIA